MIQRDLLADLPRARNSDPPTSHLAAERIKSDLGRQQSIVLAYVRQHPGSTSAELARFMAENRDNDRGLWPKWRPMFGRRLRELVPIHVREGKARFCDVTGEACLTWQPTRSE